LTDKKKGKEKDSTFYADGVFVRTRGWFSIKVSEVGGLFYERRNQMC